MPYKCQLINSMKIDKPLDCQQKGLRLLWQEAFGDSEEFLDTFFNTAFSPDRCRCVTINGQVIAALYWFNCTRKTDNTNTLTNTPIAYIYAVATAEEYRGCGICHKLMENTHTHLAGLGYEGAILVPGDEGLFRLYENMGYHACAYINEFECAAANISDAGTPLQFHAASSSHMKPEAYIIPDISTPTACDIPIYESLLQPVSLSEYARLRRLYLPSNGIIQENENLTLLETYATLYAGHDFLLACHGKGELLNGIELLGNTKKAPAIIKELGYQKGVFRTIGNERPFAMYYSFNDSNLIPPVYFGLAFD